MPCRLALLTVRPAQCLEREARRGLTRDRPPVRVRGTPGWRSTCCATCACGADPGHRPACHPAVCATPNDDGGRCQEEG